MATTTMHFGPEWMRKQPTPAPRSSLTESTTAGLGLDPTAPTPPTPSYSASIAFGVVNSEKWDGGHPLRYSKEEMIRIYQEGVKTALGPGVERWEGIVREIAADPVGTREMTDVEKRVSLLCCPSSWRRASNSLRFFHLL
jgi:PERQ amino acid-rich with GYF domain-containing protein